MATWVLHLSSETGWRGGERQVWLLARELARHGVAQAVAAPAGTPLAARIAELGVPVHPLAPGVVGLARGGWALARTLRARPGAIVHAHASPALDSARVLRRVAPVAAVVHTRRVAFPVRAARKYRVGADRYVAVSHAVAEALALAGTPRDRLRVIPSGVDFAALDAAPMAEAPFSDGGPLVGCVAQMTPEKGVATLAAAWPEVIAQRPGARLLIVGDGPERARVEQALAASAATVRLAGWRDDVGSLLKRVEVYVQPSLQEGLGSTVIDACALGIPVVASRVGGLPEVLADGAAGMLVPPSDPAALAAAVVALIDDGTRRRALGEAGRAHVRARFSHTAMADGYLRLYRELGLR